MRRTMMLVGLAVALLTVSAEAHRIIRPGNDLAGFTDTTSNALIPAVTLVDTFGNPASLGGGVGSDVTVLNESLHVYGSFSATLGDTVTVTGSVDVAGIADTVDVTIQNDSLKTYGNVAVTGTVTATVGNDSLKTYGNVAVTGTVDVADIADTVDVRLADSAQVYGTVTVGNDSVPVYGTVDVADIVDTVDVRLADSAQVYGTVTVGNDSLKTYFGAVPTVYSRTAARADMVRGTAATDADEAVVLAGVSGKNLDLTMIVCSNEFVGGAQTFTIRDSTGGPAVLSLSVPAASSVCFTFPTPLMQMTGTGNAWTATMSDGTGSCTMQAVKY